MYLYVFLFCFSDEEADEESGEEESDDEDEDDDDDDDEEDDDDGMCESLIHQSILCSNQMLPLFGNTEIQILRITALQYI